MSVLRIVQLIETLDCGGAEKLVVALAGALAKEGHLPCIVTLAGPGPLREDIDAEIPVFELGMNPRNLFSQFLSVFRLRKLCRRLGADVIQTHLPRANFFGLALTFGGGPPVFPTVHNNREFDYGRDSGGFRRKLRRRAYRVLLTRCRRMIAVSAAVRASLAEQLGLSEERAGLIAVVPNGIAAPVPPTPEDRAAARGEFAVRHGCPLIVGVGRLTPQKNFRDLILALDQLAPETPDWRCIIAGEGPLRADLAGLITATGLEGRVILAGRISQVDRLLAAADIFCLPSLWEGLPLALLEGMAAGLPIAAYAIDGIKEIVPEEIAGRLAAPGDIGQLSAALQGFIQDSAARCRMGEAGRALVVRHYGIERMVAALTRVLQDN